MSTPETARIENLTEGIREALFANNELGDGTYEFFLKPGDTEHVYANVYETNLIVDGAAVPDYTYKIGFEITQDT